LSSPRKNNFTPQRPQRAQGKGINLEFERVKRLEAAKFKKFIRARLRV
jgi:hypothetical protein